MLSPFYSVNLYQSVPFNIKYTCLAIIYMRKAVTLFAEMHNLHRTSIAEIIIYFLN